MNAEANVRCEKAFTLVEILIVVIILGILAAIVIPQFSNASNRARENTLREDLRYMRTQIMAYKIQHNDVPPGYPGGDPSGVPDEATFIAQMTNPTDENGNVNQNGRFGPYLLKIPENPLNAHSTIQVIANDGALPAEADDSHGWIYKPSELIFKADASGSDENSVAYYDY